jgi:Tfp pilus assembly protein PilF
MVRHLTVRISSFAFKGEKTDERDIASRLGVTHVLEGSVRRFSDQVRVTAQLICVSGGYHMFSTDYDRKLEDMFSVQDEIASTIVGQLAGHWGPVQTTEEERSVARRHVHNTEAYAEYLRGRFAWARFSPEGIRRAILHYERSAEMDDQCALPYSGLASASVFLGAIAHMSSTEAFPLAEAAASRAIELEPDAGDTHLAMVKIFYHWDWAYHALQKALTLTPGDTETHHLYGMHLASLGDFDEAISEARTVIQLDPLSLLSSHALGQVLLGPGRLDEAEAQLLSTLETDPNFRMTIETFARFPEKAGRVDATHEMLHLLEGSGEAHSDVLLDVGFAMAHSGLGDVERALEYLTSAKDKRMGSMVFLGTFPAWDVLRPDPCFAELLDSVGLPATREEAA